MGVAGTLSRRGFLARSMTALTLGAGLPAWYARDVLADEQERQARESGRRSANDILRVGCIGTGVRGLTIGETAAGIRGVKVAALCDVDADHREQACRLFGLDAKDACEDFRDLVARDDLDAVLVATPDHWHALAALAALRQGKDVYCEKPLTLTIAEGRPLIRAARSGNRIFQVGSQQRSDVRFRLACELARNGRIGSIRTVETGIGENPLGGPFSEVPVPEGLNWDFWQGPAPAVPYLKERCHYDFRWWYEYSGGKMTDWGAHHNDIAQWGLGTDDTGPVRIESTAEPASGDRNSFQCHPTFRVTTTYADGRQVVCTSGGKNGVRFVGENGWIFVDRNSISASDRKLIDEPLRADAVRLAVSNDHMRNFFDSVRSRKRPIGDVEIGHRSASVCHLGNISIRLGRALTWDPEAERFAGEGADEANALLSRTMRAPWSPES